MSNPFSGVPDPGFPRRSRRRFQPGVVQEALQAAKREAKRHGQNLWRRAKRNPRTFALTGGAVTLTLAGAYTLSASGVGRSLCPPVVEASSSGSKGQKTPRFVLLMDSVPQAAAGSELDIYYDVCGLPSGTPFRGRLRLLQQQAGGKKGSAKPKPLAISFQDEADGFATRRRQPFELGSTKPGVYSLELSVVDSRGRERKQFRKVQVRTQ